MVHRPLSWCVARRQELAAELDKSGQHLVPVNVAIAELVTQKIEASTQAHAATSIHLCLSSMPTHQGNPYRA